MKTACFLLLSFFFLFSPPLLADYGEECLSEGCSNEEVTELYSSYVDECIKSACNNVEVVELAGGTGKVDAMLAEFKRRGFNVPPNSRGPGCVDTGRMETCYGFLLICTPWYFCPDGKDLCPDNDATCPGGNTKGSPKLCGPCIGYSKTKTPYDPAAALGSLGQSLGGVEHHLYTITNNGDLLWYRHDGRNDGSFRWAFNDGKKVGNGWSFKQVFSGGDGIIYGITPRVEATVNVTGKITPASGGDLMWYRHVGREDGTSRWDGPKKVGSRWENFQQVFSGGDGIIYGVTPRVETTIDVTGKITPASGGDLMWYRHIGREDGTSRWEGPKKVGSRWKNFQQVFSGGDGIIYGITPRVEATVNVTGKITPASGGDLMWYRHIGRKDGTSRWEGPKKVGSRWENFQQVFSGGNGIIYGITPGVEAAIDVTGKITPASGGDLMWYRHDGHTDGSPRWAFNEGKKVGNKWNFKHVFSD